MLYHECFQKLASKFGKIRYQYVPGMQNHIVDASTTMASMMDGPKEDQARLIVVEQRRAGLLHVGRRNEEINWEGEWYSNILHYLKDGTYPKSTDKND